MSLATVILAAGMGTRMKSARIKVLHEIAGRPMIEYPVALARALGSTHVVAVLGHQSDDVRAALEARFGHGVIEVALQSEQRGTGHATQMATPLLAEHDGLVLVLSGDVPLLTEATLRRLIDAAGPHALSLLTMRVPDEHMYGRVVRDSNGEVTRIVEHKDATLEERRIAECNAGIYCAPARFLWRALERLDSNNAQGELYLTDIVAQAAREPGMRVLGIDASVEEVQGINDRIELARADKAMRWRLTMELMKSGVSVRDPERLFVEPGVLVGRDTILGAGVQLRGNTVIGENCRLEAGSIVTDCTIGNDVHVKPYCVLTESVIEGGAIIGPWAHLRPGSHLEEGVHIGNYVETKKTRMGRGSKANHLTYLGDADIGSKVNVGCGTITCNYDGWNKHKTTVGDNVFIGSDTQLVAPVTVGNDAVIAAGTTVYEDVPAGALALTRPVQVIVPGYTERKRARMSGKPVPPRAHANGQSTDRRARAAAEAARRPAKKPAKAKKKAAAAKRKPKAATKKPAARASKRPSRRP